MGDRKHHAGLGLLGKRAFDFVLMLRYWADSDLGPRSDLRDANHERGPGRLHKLRSRAPQRHRDWQFVRLRSFLRYILEHVFVGEAAAPGRIFLLEVLVALGQEFVDRVAAFDHGDLRLGWLRDRWDRQDDVLALLVDRGPTACDRSHFWASSGSSARIYLYIVAL